MICLLPSAVRSRCQGKYHLKGTGLMGDKIRGSIAILVGVFAIYQSLFFTRCSGGTGICGWNLLPAWC